jgi:hypothetical protein
MNEQTKEQFYDEQISPELIALAEKCREKGLSLLAVCEWEALKTGSTRLLQPDASIGMRMADAVVKANGNIDSFMFAIMRHAREHGHGSIILNQLGISNEPICTDSATERKS